MIDIAIDKDLLEETLNVLDEFLNCNCNCKKCFNFKRANQTVENLVSLLKEGE